jgi:hypothetical protein
LGIATGEKEPERQQDEKCAKQHRSDGTHIGEIVSNCGVDGGKRKV